MADFDVLNELWAGIIEDVVLDIDRQTLKVVIKVVESSQAYIHVLECTGIAEFRYYNSIKGPWEYAELTELHASREEHGGIRLEFVLWSEDAGIVAIADSVHLDAKSISPY